MSKPPIHDDPLHKATQPIDYRNALVAVETVKNALKFIQVGLPIIRRGLMGEVHIDVPIMYQGFALGRIHYDPYAKLPSPKGRPVRVLGISISSEEVRNTMEAIIKEVYVIEACEYREPESAWVVPLAWSSIIIAHIKVSSDGREIIPDYGLTEELRRYTP